MLDTKQASLEEQMRAGEKGWLVPEKRQASDKKRRTAHEK
jgi:hypothetical protein